LERLDPYYLQMLGLGLMLLKHAAYARELPWVQAEVELLHNIPSLIGETNRLRHRYFWFKERTAYIEWASAPGREEKRSRMRTYYEPIWREMEPVVLELTAEPS
jgi:hypothetical protein